MERRDKTNYYLDLAEMVAQRCTCLRRHYGAVIVKNDEVISTGYVGAPRGERIVRISGNVSAGRWAYREESDMNCAAVSMRKQMRLSALPGTR